MRTDWAEYGLGFVLSDGKINGQDETDYLLHAMNIENDYDFVEVMNKKKRVCRIYDDDCGGKRFVPVNGGYKATEPDYMLVIWALNQPEPFAPVYPGGPDEIRKEFKDILGEYLPNDFDWDAHIGYFNTVVSD